MASGVQQKIPCLFQPVVSAELSSKRAHQSYSVTASDILVDSAVNHGIGDAVVSEKVDGTCCYIALHEDKPKLWARLDRKPSKAAEKRFKKYVASKRCLEMQGEGQQEEKEFCWQPEKDFKEVPDGWIPASGVCLKDGVPQPDSNGHIPGWVPVEPGSRQYCWHNTVISRDQGSALVLRPLDTCENGTMELTLVDLHEVLGHTVELVGTNINGNPYKMGIKSCPLHVLIPHGCIKCEQVRELNYNLLKEYLSCGPAGNVEGLVWHCPKGQLYKLHRHHLGLPWPITDPSLALRPIVINIDSSSVSDTEDCKTNIGQLMRLRGQRVNCMVKLNEALQMACSD